MASIALGSHFEDFIRRQIARGRYNNASEVVRAGLRLLEEHESGVARELARLDRVVAHGLADSKAGRVRPAGAAFRELKARYRQQAKPRTK